MDPQHRMGCGRGHDPWGVPLAIRLPSKLDNLKSADEKKAGVSDQAPGPISLPATCCNARLVEKVRDPRELDLIRRPVRGPGVHQTWIRVRRFTRLAIHHVGNPGAIEKPIQAQRSDMPALPYLNRFPWRVHNAPQLLLHPLENARETLPAATGQIHAPDPYREAR